MIRTLADQYLAQNAGRRYPFADDCDAQDIPDSAILDFRCTVEDVPPETTPRAWLTNVGTATEGGVAYKVLTVTVERPGTADVLVFRIRQDMAAGAPYTAHARNDATGARGSMTVSAVALGLANEAKSVPFAWTTVACDSLKVHSLQSAQGEDATDEDDPAGRSATAALTGEILLAEGRNTEPYLDGNRLRLDVFKGAGLGERCQTAVSGSQRCNTVLFTINGERPGSDGDIRIVGDGGITVTPDPENHAVEIRMDDEAARRMADGCATTCPTYTKKTSALTFDANGGSGTMTTGKIATYGQAMPTGIALPTRTGYAFNGFFDDTSSGTKYYNADGTSARAWDKDTTSGTRLYAQWTAT